MDMDKLLGKEFGFFGVNENCFKIGSKVLEVIEDLGDGYISCMREVVQISKAECDKRSLHFFNEAIDKVRVEEAPASEWRCSFEGYRLVSVKDGHVWLTFGTSDYDDYYPCFVFEYEPKPGRNE